MTNEEAMKYIIQHCNPDYPKGKTEWETAINMAISALEKQMPKKPTLHKGWLYCSVCGKDVLMEGYKFCPDCGQRIDWSDEG